MSERIGFEWLQGPVQTCTLLPTPHQHRGVNLLKTPQWESRQKPTRIKMRICLNKRKMDPTQNNIRLKSTEWVCTGNDRLLSIYKVHSSFQTPTMQILRANVPGISVTSTDEVDGIASSSFRVGRAFAQDQSRKNKTTVSLNHRKMKRMSDKMTLPNHSSTIARALHHFFQFIFGMPDSPTAYPPSPTAEETQIWEQMHALRLSKLKAHFERFRETICHHPIAEQKILLGDEERRVNKIITPPPFKAARDRTCPPGTDISMVVKKTLEQSLRAAGFGRFNFNWTAHPFSTSNWNQSISSIIAKHFNSWVKTTPNMDCIEVGVIVAMLGRWVRGQHALMVKEEKSPGSVARGQAASAKSSQRKRLKKQVCSIVP